MKDKTEAWDYEECDQPLSWNEFVDEFGKLPPSSSGTLTFRGHADGTWPLEPTLRRICQKEGLGNDKILSVERRIFEEFKFSAHHYYDLNITGGGDAWKHHIEALGWIQHYGGPTRCLDFTMSPFVAAFFAMENLLDSGYDRTPDRYPAIIEMEIQQNQLLEVAGGKLEFNWMQWQGVFQKKNRDMCGCDLIKEGFFFTLPRKLHERFDRQQGLVLVPLAVKESLHNLLANRKTTKRHRLDLKSRKDYLVGLKKMNITRRSLFEGPDAWAKSLHRFAWEVGAKDRKP